MTRHLLKLWRWLFPPPCAHTWYLILENYPSFAKNWWGCHKCQHTEERDFDDPPTKVKRELCSMGHFHTREAK